MVRSSILRRLPALLVVIAALGGAAIFTFGPRDDFARRLTAFFEHLQQLGPWGPVVVGALFLPICLLFLPGSPVTLFGGFAFGKTLPGFLTVTACVSLGSTLGASLAFLVGRTLLRDWVQTWVAGNARFRAIDAAVGQKGFQIVLLTRLSPVFPFNLLNYSFGLTGVSFRDYVLGSWLGMLPGTVMFVYLGATLGDLADVLAGRVERTPLQQALFYGGLAATVALAVYVGRVARRAINAAVPSSPVAAGDDLSRTAN